MKRTVLLLALSVIAWQMNAQINEPGKFYLTPKVGYNMANITLLDKFGADPRHGINAGIAAEYAINNMISIEPGFFYSMQGSVIKAGTVKLHLNSDYFVMPVLVKTYLSKGLNVFAGPAFGYLTSSRFRVKSGIRVVDVITDIVSKNIDLTKYENEFDAAFVFGLGYQLDNGFNISANYSLGMLNVPKLGDIKIGDQTYTLDPDAKNTVLQVNIGYRF